MVGSREQGLAVGGLLDLPRVLRGVVRCGAVVERSISVGRVVRDARRAEEVDVAAI